MKREVAAGKTAGNFRRVCPIFNRAIGKMKRHGEVTQDIPPFGILLWRRSVLRVLTRPSFPELSFVGVPDFIRGACETPGIVFKFLKALLNHPQI